MSATDSSEIRAHGAKHWAGKYWGESGAVCAGLFALLSTLYSALKSAPTRKHKLLVGAGVVLLYVVIRTTYDRDGLTANQLDVLASVSRRLKLHGHAILCGERALRHEGVSFTSRMLLIAGLMRDHDVRYAADQPGAPAHQYFHRLRAEKEDDAYSPPEQEIRIWRALAWFTNKYPAMDRSEARWYANEALSIAIELRADDQVAEIRREFAHLL